jgi:hypothetical protein
MHSSKQLETIFAHRTCPTVGQRTPLRPVHMRIRRSYWLHIATRLMNSTTSTSGAATLEHPMLGSSEVAARRVHQTLGQRPMLWEPASGAPKASVRCTKNSEEHFQKITESYRASSAARQEGERVLNPSLPLKLHLLRKSANTTKCNSPCTCVLTFSTIILKELG